MPDTPRFLVAAPSHLGLLAALTILATACGVAGEKGAAIFHVGSNWQPARPIALGSTFAASAQKNDLLKTNLTVRSADTKVISQLAGGSFRAVGNGVATFEALDPGSQAVVDSVHFEVSTPTVASLSWPIDKLSSPSSRVDDKGFALVTGQHARFDPELADSLGRSQQHASIATMTATGNVTLTAVAPGYDVTATALGSATLQLNVAGPDDKTALTKSFAVTIVSPADVASIDVMVTLLGKGTVVDPNKPDAPQPAGDAVQTTGDRIYQLVVRAKTAGDLRVYGVPAVWTEVGGGSHLLLKTAYEVNYAVLKAGQKVSFHVQVGALGKDVELTGP